MEKLTNYNEENWACLNEETPKLCHGSYGLSSWHLGHFGRDFFPIFFRYTQILRKWYWHASGRTSKVFIMLDYNWMVVFRVKFGDPISTTF